VDRSLPMVKVAVDDGHSITMSSFVDGLLHVTKCKQTLEDRIKEYPMEVLQKLIRDGTYHNHRNICNQCIDRMCELERYAEIAKMFKLYLR